MEERSRELVSLLLDQHPCYKPSPVSVDSLLDTLLAVYEDCKLCSVPTTDKSNSIQRFISKYEKVVEELKRIRVNSNDFTTLRCLARGQFGEVFLVRSKADHKVYAMKTLRKSDMLKQADIAFFMEERHILAAMESQWLTRLVASFQDEVNLYLVMEFIPGGDLGTILMKADEGLLTIDEPFARFYIAETALALRDLHQLNFVHRDIKPGNILIDEEGHVKLTDFGSCIHLNKKDGVTSMVTVGTPDYISPEVLMSNEGKGTYGVECDFWSLGITLYEMLIGQPPFYADTLLETYNQIMNHKQFFTIPEDMNLSVHAVGLLRKLVCDKSERIKSFDELCRHPFFAGFDWTSPRKLKPPFVPALSSDDDVSNFPEVDDLGTDQSNPPVQNRKTTNVSRQFVGENLAFIGYTFFRHNNASINSVLQTQSSHASAAVQLTVSTSKNPSELNAEIRESKLDGDSQRFNELEQSRIQLQSESDRLRQLIAGKERFISDRMGQISSLERALKMTQLELADTIKKLEIAECEQKSLNYCMQSIQGENEKTVVELLASKQANSALKSERDKFHEQIKDFQQKILDFQQKISGLEGELAESKKAKAMAEIDARRYKVQSEQAQEEHQQFARSLVELEENLEKELELRTELERKMDEREVFIRDLQSRLGTMQKDLQANQELLCSAKKRIEVVEGTNVQLERQVAILSGKPEPVRSIPEIQVPSSLNPNTRSTEFRADSARLQVQRPNMQSKLDEVQSNIATHIKETKMLRERSHSASSRPSLGSRSSNRPSFLGSHSNVTDELMLIRFERQNNDLQREKALIELELAEYKKKLGAQESQRETVEQKLKVMEQRLAEYQQKRLDSDNKCQVLQDKLAATESAMQSLQTDLKNLRNLKNAQDSTILEIKKSNALLELQRDEVNQRLAMIFHDRAELEVEYERTKGRLNDLLNHHVGAQAFSKLTDECSKLHRKLKETEAKYESLQIAYAQISTEYTLIRSDTSLLSPDSAVSAPSAVETSDLSKRARNNISKMRALEQKLDAEIAMRASAEAEVSELRRRNQALETEVEDIKRIGGGGGRIRASSTVSSLSSLLNVKDTVTPRKLKIRSLFLPDNGNNSSQQNRLQGWLKIRLSQPGKKSKYEWVKRFAVIRNNKFYLFEREKDKDSALDHVSPLIDIKPVSNKELIHLSNKDSLCVFSIEVASHNNSLASIQYQTQQQQLLADAEEQKRRIETLEAAIAKEEKFRQAAEKIIAVSSDETQKRTKSELDECVRRLRLLRSELQALQCLSRNESPSDGRQNSPTSPSPNNDNNKRATSMIHIRASSYIPPSSPSYQTKSMTMLTNMPPSPGAIAQKASQQIHEHNGHMFINKQQDATATCYHCHDILFGLNQSVQCTQCRMVCHKFCHTSVSVTCQEYMELRHARKWYLMAADEADRSRWVHLLDNMKVYTIVDPDALRAAYPSTGH